MAFMAKTILFFFLVLVSSLQIQARESKFFNKFTHISVKSKVIPESQISQAPTSAPMLAPTPAESVTAPAEAPALFYAESENGYGLHSHGYGQFPRTKENVPSTTNENDLFNEELSTEKYETGYQNSNYKNNVYNNNYNTNGYEIEKQGMSDTRFTQNYRNSNYNHHHQYTNDNNYGNEYTNYNNENKYTNGNNYNNNVYADIYNNNGYSSHYNTDSYEIGKKGMSDTRFLENGKYYYDVKNENNYFPNEVTSQREAATNEGYYGNTQNENEFNTMEEFENEKYEKYEP